MMGRKVIAILHDLAPREIYFHHHALFLWIACGMVNHPAIRSAPYSYLAPDPINPHRLENWPLRCGPYKASCYDIFPSKLPTSGGSLMHLKLELPRARLRQWHLWLIEQLRAQTDLQVGVALTEAENKPAAALSLLLTLESLIQARSEKSGTALISARDIPAAIDGADTTTADLVICLGGGSTGAPNADWVTVTFDGQTNEDALWLAVLERRAPVITVETRARGGTASEAGQTILLPALEAPHSLSTSADAIFSRIIESLCEHVERHTNSKVHPPSLAPPSEFSGAPKTRSSPSLLLHSSAFLCRRVTDKARALLAQWTKTAPRWQVAWRPRGPLKPDSHARLAIDDFAVLRDDGARYYADPFCVSTAGKTYVFVEEFPYTTQRGLISVFEIQKDSRTSTPRPVLEADHHLSYPHVFEHAGAFWMVPEACASGGVDLYRAETLPDRWILEARLLDQPVHDATVHFDGQRWWMFAATQFLKSSTWCALKLYTADDLRGPWQPFSTFPVKTDGRSARPAGAIVQVGDTLWRPTQDCSTGYGHSLTWCHIDALAPDQFAEQPRGSLRFEASSRCLGPHTWTGTETIEAIDLFAAARAR